MNQDNSETVLCKSCGLCCTAALYRTALLDPEEIAPARALGLEVDEEPGRQPRFRQPCPRYADSCCTIYPDRPRVCRTYFCRLLKQLRDGEVEPSRALAIVTEGRRLAAEAQACLDPGQSLPDGPAMLTDPAAPPLHKLRFLAFGRYMDQHFRRKSDGPWFLDQPLAASPGEKN